MGVNKINQLFPRMTEFPAIERCISLIMNEEIESSKIQELIVKEGGNLIDSVVLVDIYRGVQIPTGKKSLTYSIRYRSHLKTLTGLEVEQLQQKIVESLMQNFQILKR